MSERMRCKRCLTESSVFWTPFCVGPCRDPDDSNVFYLCDDCLRDFAHFIRGCIINELVVKKARAGPRELVE